MSIANVNMSTDSTISAASRESVDTNGRFCPIQAKQLDLFERLGETREQRCQRILAGIPQVKRASSICSSASEPRE